MKACHCEEQHRPRRIVLTGGPGAGKTAVLELVRHGFCKHIVVLPEAAGILFGGGFPRGADPAMRQASQRAIYFVQRELEAAASLQNAALVLCDRGTIDGGAYWPAPGDLWTAVGTSLTAELARYDAVIHLCTPADANGYNHNNPLRIESAKEAAAIDARIEALWAGHPRRTIVPSTADFVAKAKVAVDCVRAELPECCRGSAR